MIRTPPPFHERSPRPVPYVLPPRRLLAVAVLNLVLLALVLFLCGCAVGQPRVG